MGNGERGIVRWGEKFFSPTSRTSTDAFAAHPHDFWGTRVKRKTVARMVFISRNVREVREVFCFRCLEIRSFEVLEIFSKGFIILLTPSLPTPSLPPQPFSAPLCLKQRGPSAVFRFKKKKHSKSSVARCLAWRVRTLLAIRLRN